MGAWLDGHVCMSVVATENFYTINRLLAGSASGSFTAAVQKLGQPQARDLLRYLSSELNRLYFQIWNVAQLVLGVLALWLVARSPQQHPAGARRATLGRDRDAGHRRRDARVADARDRHRSAAASTSSRAIPRRPACGISGSFMPPTRRSR